MKPRAVVVTGASTGIGRACALDLDRRGFRVFGGVRRDEDAADLRAAGSERLTTIMLDVADADSIRSAAEEVTAAVGEDGLTGLVNNAGIAVAGPLEFVPMRLLRQQLEVNVIGQVAVTQAFLPRLRAARGRIVNIGSVSGLVSLPMLGPYAASKFALEALTDALRMELAPWGIHVAIVEPASIATPIWERSRARADEMIRDLPPEAQRYYGRAMEVMRRGAERSAERGLPPERVVSAVVHALTAGRPRTRYLVATPRRARRLRALRLLPDRWRDWLVRRTMG